MYHLTSLLDEQKAVIDALMELSVVGDPAPGYRPVPSSGGSAKGSSYSPITGNTKKGSPILSRGSTEGMKKLEKVEGVVSKLFLSSSEKGAFMVYILFLENGAVLMSLLEKCSASFCQLEKESMSLFSVSSSCCKRFRFQASRVLCRTHFPPNVFVLLFVLPWSVFSFTFRFQVLPSKLIHCVLFV